MVTTNCVHKQPMWCQYCPTLTSLSIFVICCPEKENHSRQENIYGRSFYFLFLLLSFVLILLVFRGGMVVFGRFSSLKLPAYITATTATGVWSKDFSGCLY